MGPVTFEQTNVTGNVSFDYSTFKASANFRGVKVAHTAKFERADVFALTEHEQQTLGEEGQGSEEFVLRPGETRTLTRELKKGVQFVGIAVLFDRSRWRVVAPVGVSGPTKLMLRVNGLNATMA